MAKILIIEDDPNLRRGMNLRLRANGYETALAEDGVTAVFVARAERPDLALVDIGLPDGDGFSLTQQLRAMPWPMRVVLISSDSDRANAPAARRAGACGFFPKDELSDSALRQLIEGD